jgi:hypothetical protein
MDFIGISIDLGSKFSKKKKKKKTTTTTTCGDFSFGGLTQGFIVYLPIK